MELGYDGLFHHTPIYKLENRNRRGIMKKQVMILKKIFSKENILLLIFILFFWTSALEKSFFKISVLYEHRNVFIYSFFLVCILIIYKLELKISVKDAWEKKEEYLKVIMLGVLFIVLGEVIAGITVEKMGIFSANETGIQETLRDKIYAFPVIVIFGPIVEEVIFRKIIYKKIRSNNKYLRLESIFFVALIFAVHHCIAELYVGNFIQLVANLPVFIAGIGYTIVYEKTGNICCPIIVHMILNLIAFQG